MKIKFDSSQPDQRDSTDAVLALFDGHPLSRGAFEFAMVAGTLLKWRAVSGITRGETPGGGPGGFSKATVVCP